MTFSTARTGFILLVLTAGCDRPGDPDYGTPVPVGGVVRVGGRPAGKIRVTFVPTDGRGKEGTGDTAADGQFTLTTFRTGDGAVPGRYVVTLEPAPGAWGPRLPPRYADAGATDLRDVEVTPWRENTFDFGVR
jgi:hypothetical protein